MAGTIPNEGETSILENAFKNTTPEAFTLKLFSNSATLANSNTAAAFTESAISGYAAKALARASFSAAVPGSPSSISYSAAQTFNFTGSGTIYGYFIVGATSGKVYAAETLYPTGQAFASGDSLSITPKITFGSVTND
jgi:hypothetical protein